MHDPPAMEDRPTRELTREGTQWTVREMATTDVPGARAARCLIVESAGVVRRLWGYPECWFSLDDETLWSLTEDVARTRPWTRDDDARIVTTVTRRLLALVMMLREGDVTETATLRVLQRQCRRSRAVMEAVVNAYGARLRREGVTPEEAVVLLKHAVREGVVGPSSDEPDAVELLDAAVAWCIAAYFAE